MNTRPPDKPNPAESPWIPFKRLMRVVVLCAVLAVIAALATLHFTGAPARWEMWLAVAGGVAGTILLTGALMGLVFISSRSGHDDSVGRGD